MSCPTVFYLYGSDKMNQRYLTMRYYLFLIPLLFLGCTSNDLEVDFEQESVLGYKPIYATEAETTYGIEAAKPISRAGKIYGFGNLLLVNEQGLGVHIYDNTDPKNPVNKLFVRIPGNHDIAMRKGILYADSFSDLLALEINADTAIVLKRIANVMGQFSGEFPQATGVYFECVDESKGLVVGWEQTTLNKPKCYRP